MARSAFARALSRWRRVVGEAHVRTEQVDLVAAATATYATSHRVLGIVLPKTRDEVRACVEIAAQHGVPVYPVSRGKNWGYGSRAPAHDASVILDLSRMTRIVRVDAVRGSVTVQPGVSTSALFTYLRRHAPAWSAALPTATTTGASVVGNALDGGLSSGPYGDRFAHVYSLEVVLATGEVIRTGLDRWEGGSLLGATEARVGPSLRNLFVQSSFGIVTEMTIGLFPVPRDLRRLRVKMARTEDIGPFLERIRPLIIERVLPDPLGIFNDYENISVTIPYPWAWTYGRTPLPTAVLSQLREALSRPRWAAITEIASADRSIGDAREQVVRRALEGYDLTVTDVTSARETYYAPTGEGMFGLYWRKRGGAVPDADPNRDRCGLVWCDFVMASDPVLLATMLLRVEPLVRSYGFEPAVEVHAVWPRATYIVISLAYDRERPGEDDRAEACDRALTAYFARFDVLPARRRVGSMDLLPRAVDDSPAVFARIKAALDPANIVAPGRYDGAAQPPPRVALLASAETATAQTERANLAALERSNDARSRSVGRPLRPLFIDRARYDLVQRAAQRFVAAMLEVAPRIASSATWRALLGLDEDVADALARQLHESAITGVVHGAFDDRTGTYRTMGFETSMAGIAQSTALSARSPAKGWSSLLRRPSLGARVAVIEREAPDLYAGALRRFARNVVPVTPGSMAATVGTDRVVYSDRWRELLGRRGWKEARAMVLGGQRTNASSDVLLGSLAGMVTLHEEAATGRLGRQATDFVEEHVPWTALVESRAGQRIHGERIDLLPYLLANKERFVLRPLFRGQTTWIGEYVTPGDWRKVVRSALSSTQRRRPAWVAQERIRIEHQVFPVCAAEGIAFEGCFVGLDVVVVDGRIEPGLAARISERPRVGAGCDGTHSVPAFVGPTIRRRSPPA